MFISQVFTQEGLEKNPTAEVPRQEIFRVPKPGTTDWENASKDHVDLYNQTMDHIKKRVNHRRILTKPVFQDFDLYVYTKIILMNQLRVFNKILSRSFD